ncbi:MAG: Holliday junction resolvase RuvX [Bacteroidota bacterium]
MARVMAIDYGTKRTGLAVTDPLQIIATALTTVPTTEALDYISRYAVKENVIAYVIGIPRHLDNTDALIVPLIEKFISELQKKIPGAVVHRVDERFTSMMATKSLLESGQSRKTRQDKSVIDKISATIILQWWMEQKQR